MRTASLLLLLSLLAAASSYEWGLPKGFPVPRVPTDNPMTPEKVELGRHLFYDRRLSVNGKTSCATCHRQELAFTDGRTVALGTTGELHPRNTMSLVNVAYESVLTWASPNLTLLEDQLLVPLYGEHPVEMGLSRDEQRTSELFRQDPVYRRLFAAAFPDDASSRYSAANMARAIASFERCIISARSPYDRYHYAGEESAVCASAKRGEVLFFSQPLSCFRCHGGFTFSGNMATSRRDLGVPEFHNTGLAGLFTPPNTGVAEFTHLRGDIGRFKAPTLRNIAVTPPYMHDGRIATLDEVLDHYASGGDPHENKSSLITGFQLSSQDRRDLLAFLKSLTDEPLLHDRRFSNPW